MYSVSHNKHLRAKRGIQKWLTCYASFGLRAFALSLALFGFASAASARTTEALDHAQKQRLIEKIGHRLQKVAYAYQTDFSRWNDYAAAQSAAIEAADSHESLTTALLAAMDEFHLSHLSLFTPSASKLQRAGMRFGIGVSIRDVPEGLFVTYVLPESPAHSVGIRKLDTITRIDEQDIEDVSMMAGEPGQQRQIEWITAKGEARAAQIEYRAFPAAERSSWRWIDERTALLRVQSFQYRFYRAGEIRRAMRELRHAEAVIIDLRGNRGGLSFYSRHLAARFVERKTPFARMVNRRHIRRAERAEVGPDLSMASLLRHARILRPIGCPRPYTGKVAVLVDSLSASGADIFPAFIQETGRGIVIGEPTAGALQMARTFRLPYGFRLYAPTAEILTPNGRRLEGEGLQPDIPLDFEQAADDETILAIALEALHGPTAKKRQPTASETKRQ